MISTLHSIDSLLNKFDELSICHANLLSNFDTNFSDIKNPLRHVARTEDEQRKSVENILSNINENDKQFESNGSLADFHRRTIKIRYLHRPPCYSSNDTSLTQLVPTRSPSITIESSSLPKISKITIKADNPQPIIPIPNKNIIEPKSDLTTKNRPKVVSQNVFSPRQHARSIITAFTMETVNRLSKPRRYNRLPEQRPSTKHMKQQSKLYGTIKKDASKCSTLPPIKRTNTKPSLKKVKSENKILTQTVKRNPVNNFSRPLVFVAPIPTICLNFPTQQQQKSFRVVYLPKIITAIKRPIIHLKT